MIIVNKDLTIIGGHQRLKVLKDLGFTEVDCVVIEIDKTKEKAFKIALNKVTGSWDEPAISRQGDIWLLGEHRLICGDSTLAETNEKQMEGKKANLVVTDPPYNVSI